MKKLTLFLFGLFLLKVSFSQTTLTLSNLPLQININEGANTAYTFDQSIDAVASRNPGVVSWQISGTTVTFKGLKPGRTGLKITAGSSSYYLGLRVNKSNGTIPGMPDYVSIASVSEDISGDLLFWKDIQPGAKNKSMDVRYIYINGGPVTGWHNWGPKRPGQFARESLRHGLIPFFIYYNIPDGDESYQTDLKHIQDPTYMTAYFKDLNIFLDSVENVMKGELYGIILEPDFLGYMQQNAVPNDPLTIKTAVSATSIASNAGNLATLVTRINKTIQTKRNAGSNLIFGWQQNLWSTPNFQGPQGICRRTDDNSFAAGKYYIQWSAREATTYHMKSGVLTAGADFVSIDKYGLDAMGTNADADPAKVTWFWNNDHWKNYLLYCKTMHETADKPVILWQLPVGRINQSTFVSAYTGAPYADMSNAVPTKYEDSSTDFFLGDSINTTDPVRTNYFSQNKWNDSKLIKNGNMISWGQHIKDCKDAGIICVQFGAGVGASTDGVGNPPTDNYFWIQKVQNYYLRGTVPLDQSYPVNSSCTGGCAPKIKFITPVDNGSIFRSNLDSAQLLFSVWDNDGSIASLTATIDGTINMTTDVNAVVQHLKWVPPTSFGQHTLKVSATDNNGLNTTQTITFKLVKTDPAACGGYPEWDANTTYTTANTLVIYNGLIFKNKYWTKGDMPYMGGASTPWVIEGVCPGNDINTDVPVLNAEEPFFMYPNPTNGMLYFNNHSGSSGEVNILDIKGAVLFKGSVHAGQNEIDVRQFSQGIYFMQIQLNGKVHYQKLIRQ